MPDMSGEQLYKIMKNKYPNTSERVIFMTGDTVTPETQNLLASTGRPVLSKPFDYTELIKMVDDTLRERRATVTRTKRKTQSVAATL
jgi:DNA-binding NtrC family response regulator